MNFDLEKLIAQQSETKYLIPKNIKARFEIFGVGLREIFAILISGIAGFMIISFLGIFIEFKTFTKVIVIAAFGGVSFLMVIEDPREGLSIIKFIRLYKEFLRKQRKFFYFQNKRGD